MRERLTSASPVREVRELDALPAIMPIRVAGQRALGAYLTQRSEA
jgi:hypothetical protein